MQAHAVAPSNIALVKYWGKRDERLNLPAAGSLSMTLSGLETHTTVTFDQPHGRDSLVLDGREIPPESLGKVRRVLDAVRARTGLQAGAHVSSRNTFPTGAGLASSASGLSALAVAAAAAAGWDATPEELSALARLGSGSAARSIVGGFAEWLPGSAADGSDSYAIQVAPPEHWALRLLAVVVEDRQKPVSSTSGMAKTAATSPYYPAWLGTVPADLATARTALLERDFEALARVSERSCLCMHAAMLTSEPSLLYFRPATLAVLQVVRELQAGGHSLFFTIDAGPNVKVVLPPSEGDAVDRALAAVPGVRTVLHSRPGPGTRLTAAGSAE